jgi:hypothetical protein
VRFDNQYRSTRHSSEPDGRRVQPSRCVHLANRDRFSIVATGAHESELNGVPGHWQGRGGRSTVCRRCRSRVARRLPPLRFGSVLATKGSAVLAWVVAMAMQGDTTRLAPLRTLTWTKRERSTNASLSPLSGNLARVSRQSSTTLFESLSKARSEPSEICGSSAISGTGACYFSILPISPSESEATLDDEEREILEEMERDLGRPLTEEEEHLALEPGALIEQPRRPRA